MSEPGPTDTQVLKLVGPAVYWLRKNFSLPSVLTIAGVLATAGGYLIALRTRVVVLETEVMTIKEIAPDAKALAVLTQRVDDHARRLEDIEDTVNTAKRNSQLPIGPAPRRRR